MAQNYLPFPTSQLNSEEASLVRAILQDCIPCNAMCIAPHAVPHHSRYTHIHTLGSSLFVTIMTHKRRNGSARIDSFKALIEDTSRLLMKGILLPAGHYPVSSSVQTVTSSTAPPPAAGISGAASTENNTTMTFPFAPSGITGEITLTDVDSMYNASM